MTHKRFKQRILKRNKTRSNKKCPKDFFLFISLKILISTLVKKCLPNSVPHFLYSKSRFVSLRALTMSIFVITLTISARTLLLKASSNNRYKPLRYTCKKIKRDKSGKREGQFTFI